jgi:hypothetical protein
MCEMQPCSRRHMHGTSQLAVIGRPGPEVIRYISRILMKIRQNFSMREDVEEIGSHDKEHSSGGEEED